MNDATMTCQDEQRRHRVRDREPALNGLDYLEVYDDDGRPRLEVYFLNKLGDLRERITRETVRISGGRRITNIQVADIGLCLPEDPERDDCLLIWLDQSGDFSTYTLCLVELDEQGRPTEQPLAGLDPRYACLEFSFKAGCSSDLDCKPYPVCPPPEWVEPELDYLAKDYASFRQLILDRLALIMPDWQERHVPDLGLALVELLAYSGDQLSYYQDAVASEAYLETARQRISVRRHVRLVDYALHEGCNARAWLCVEISGDNHLSLDSHEVYFITGANEVLPLSGRVLTPDELRNIPAGRYEVFEPLPEPPTPPALRRRDLKDPGCLAVKLRDGLDPVSAYLRQQFSADTQRLLAAYADDGFSPPVEALQQALVDELNRLIHDDDLDGLAAFGQVQLPGDRAAQAALPQRVTDRPDRIRLNRWYLEAAYPQDIARSRGPDEPLRFYEAHNAIFFYTWGDQECCLPRGATRATLKDTWFLPETPPPTGPEQQMQRQEGPKDKPAAPPGLCDLRRKLGNLQPGDVLIFEEVIGPETGNPADADPTRRHPVRLTRVEFGLDPLITEPVEGYDQGLPVPVVEIEWASADALPFPLCISAILPPPACELRNNISLARGNVILVDHGRRIDDESLGRVPLETTLAECGDECQPPEVGALPGRFRPRLQQTPLTFSQPPAAEQPAARALAQEPRQALPWLRLRNIPPAPMSNDVPRQVEPLFSAADLKDPTILAATLRQPAADDLATNTLRLLLSSETQKLLNSYDGAASPPGDLLEALIADLESLLQSWMAQPDLLASGPDDFHLVVEMDNECRAHLRFGDGELGRLPAASSEFIATYRIGHGPAGNVGAETISHMVLRRTRLSGVSVQPRNPLPAQGGTPPEPLEEVKLFAPYAFRTRLERAITADDYAQVVMRDFADQVQRAAATLRWTGSWYEVLVAVDPRGQVAVEPDLLAKIKGHLYPYRRIGHDLVVRAAHYVPLDVELLVCVRPDFMRGHVKAALLERFSNRRLPDGTLGFFHPDNLTFGQGIRLSRLVAAAQAVPGVENVIVTRLERLNEGPNQEIEQGLLPLGPFEIARLDNDPTFPENGLLKLEMGGGR